MLKRLKKFFQLPLNEIILLLPAFLFLSLAKLAIIILPFRLLQKYFQQVTNVQQQEATNAQKLHSKALAINRMASIFTFLGFTCLPKAMALKYWAKKEADLKVNFGVQKDNNNALIAHAWVSKQTKIILGEDPSINYKSIWVWG
jgi:hypothetical protein